jgi:hypothetical protein
MVSRRCRTVRAATGMPDEAAGRGPCADPGLLSSGASWRVRNRLDGLICMLLTSSTSRLNTTLWCVQIVQGAAH